MSLFRIQFLHTPLCVLAVFALTTVLGVEGAGSGKYRPSGAGEGRRTGGEHVQPLPDDLLGGSNLGGGFLDGGATIGSTDLFSGGNGPIGGTASSGGTGGGPPPRPLVRPFTYAVCITNYESTSSDCFDESLEKSGERLSMMILQTYLEGRWMGVLEVKFPGSATYNERFKALRDLELAAINMVTVKLKDDVVLLQPFPSQSEEEKRMMRGLARQAGQQLRQWEQRARDEADTGSNWRDSGHGGLDYGCGGACGQLQHINSRGWGGF